MSQVINHETVNTLLKRRCSNSCGHYLHKPRTPECWKACATAREYMEYHWKVNYPPHRFSSATSVEEI
jgi:hypothetical protein